MGLTCSGLNYTKYPTGFDKYLVEHISLKFINIVAMFSVTYSAVKIKDYLVLIDKVVWNQGSKWGKLEEAGGGEGNGHVESYVNEKIMY